MTRSGRLHGAWEFRRLPREQAERIAARHNLVLPDQPDYSLAEIFRGPAKLNVTAPSRTMGFAAVAIRLTTVVEGRPLVSVIVVSIR